ncbi:FAD-dependent monooxygenase, partial [bacterium]|nr:FAD-dependent monooxygenase [bacterium]
MCEEVKKIEKLDEVIISRAIINEFMKDFMRYLDTDVAIVGAGPAGLMAGYCLAKKGRKVAIFERKLSI